MKIFAIDLERTGQYGKINFTTQVGICCLDTDKIDINNIIIDNNKMGISIFSSYLPQPEGSGWEDRCVTQFWEKNPELYELTKKNVENADSNAVEKMLAWIDENRDPDPAKNILITDNSAFDFVYFAELLVPYQRSLLYLFGEYESQPIDVGNYYLGLLNRNIIRDGCWGNKKILGDCPDFFKLLNLTQHNAGHDALVIGLKFIYVSSKI